MYTQLLEPAKRGHKYRANVHIPRCENVITNTAILNANGHHFTATTKIIKIKMPTNVSNATHSEQKLKTLFWGLMENKMWFRIRLCMLARKKTFKP